MTSPGDAPARLHRWAAATLLPCFDGTTVPDWVRQRVGAGMAGVCLFARNIDTVEQVATIGQTLTSERDDVVIAIDEEAGDVTRLDAATGSRFPGAAALGRVDDPDMTRQIATHAGALMAEAGISLNLAPCADVAINPDNPVIGVRSFGASPDLVARHTAAWVTGQQAAGVTTCAKHFPGHGDTAADSHHSTATVAGSLDDLRRTALPPFAAAIDAGTAAIMPGHLMVPEVDDRPASVSRTWLADVLRRDLGFNGTIVTDALDMAAVQQRYGIGGSAVRALAAGADLLCLSGLTLTIDELDAIQNGIVRAVLDGTLSEERLAEAAGHNTAVGLTAARAAADPHATQDHRDSHTDTGWGRATSATPHDALALTAARRAIATTGPLPALREPVHVVRCVDKPNMAVGDIPWGPALAMSPAPQETVVHVGDPLPASLASAGTVLIALQDRHRHPWMCSVVDDVRQIRPDAIVVEMGLGELRPDDAPAIASFGATAVNAEAVASYLSAGSR